MPKIEGENLAGQKVLLPDAAAGKIAVLIFGFTKASKGPTSAWADKLNADFGTRPDFTLYQLPVLEDVPRLLRGMVISGIKKGVAENTARALCPHPARRGGAQEGRTLSGTERCLPCSTWPDGRNLSPDAWQSGQYKLCSATRRSWNQR